MSTENEWAEGLIGWFVPFRMRRNMHKFHNVRLFLISHLLAPLILFPIIVHLLKQTGPSPNPNWILAASLAAMGLFPFAVKAMPRWFIFWAFLSVQNMTFAILFGSYVFGGASSPFIIWILAVPLLGVLYLGPERGTKTILFIQILAGLMLFYSICGFYISNLNFELLDQPQNVAMISTIAAVFLVFWIAVHYSDTVDSQLKLRTEVERHQLTLVQLTEAKEEAERANGAKSNFLANMSHELRTPLNAVLGYSEILLDDAELEGRSEAIADLQKISAAGKHLLSMVDDVLDISKIEAGKTELYLQRFNLEQFAREVESTARPLAAKKNNALVVLMGNNLGEVQMDETKLRQSVFNLLSNAAKFTENGQITLCVERYVEKSVDLVSISVRDTGVGISKDNMSGLFSNFSQANASTAAKFGGTGLGLSLSRNLCRMMGGEITVQSTISEGSCFTIIVPAIVTLDSSSEIADEIDPPRSSSSAAFSLDTDQQIKSFDPGNAIGESGV